MQVEVTIQDYFEWGDRTPNPISSETWEIWFQTWLVQLQPDQSPLQRYELSLRLTNDTEIQALNAQYRHHDQPTDVLSFSALEVDDPAFEMTQESEPLYLGDLVISVETADQQAQQRGHSLQQELAWLATHGLLHLLGWDHPDEPDLLRMLHQQTHLLRIIGFESVNYDANEFA